ncbi:MAG: DNA polymerase III subunit [Clostridiales bacterium]|nr:DNA polymerase III subunit [Clostridiales bacterium]
MHFKNQSENEKLAARLNRVVKEDRISHAYIFEGDHSMDKRSFAKTFVKGILCLEGRGENCGKCNICDKIDHGNHEDLILVENESGSLKDAQITEMQTRLKTMPFGSRNIVIVSGSDAMTGRAQNRLLKTLEEPPGKSVIILLSENMENLTPTIQSRCVKYRLNHKSSQDGGKLGEKARRLIEMTLKKKPFYMIKKEAEPILKDTEEVAALLDSMQMIYRDMLLQERKGISLYKDDDIMDMIYEVEEARKQIRQGVSSSYAVKNLLLKIGG